MDRVTYNRRTWWCLMGAVMAVMALQVTKFPVDAVLGTIAMVLGLVFVVRFSNMRESNK